MNITLLHSAFIIPSPTCQLLNACCNNTLHGQNLQSFHQPSANISIKTSVHTVSAYVSPRNARPDGSLSSCPTESKPKRLYLQSSAFFGIKQKRWTRFQSCFRRPVYHCPGFCSQTLSASTQVFTARVLTRPQHGMRPMRRLCGPFLFLNHLILCPLRWKLTPLKQRNGN